MKEKQYLEIPMKSVNTHSILLSVFSSFLSIGTLLLYNIPFFHYVATNTHENRGGKIFLLAILSIINATAVDPIAPKTTISLNKGP